MVIPDQDPTTAALVTSRVTEAQLHELYRKAAQELFSLVLVVTHAIGSSPIASEC